MKVEELPVAVDSLQAQMVAYRVESDVIAVLRLFHGAQDWPNLP